CEPGLRGLDSLRRLFVRLVEALFALLDPCHLGLERGEVLRRARATLLGLGEGGPQAADLRLGGLEPAAPRGGLTCEPRETLTSVRDRPQCGREGPLGLR